MYVPLLLKCCNPTHVYYRHMAVHGMYRVREKRALLVGSANAPCQTLTMPIVEDKGFAACSARRPWLGTLHVFPNRDPRSLSPRGALGQL